jgi:Na+/melibiose symporter-like transporter
LTGGHELGVRGAWTATLLYGCAHYGKSLFWYASEFLFAFFLTEVGAISADRMGLVLAAGLFVSAGIDIGVGSQLSRLLPNAASAGRLQLAGAAASAASMLLMFACYWLPDDVRLLAVLAMSLMFRIAYALYDIPQNSLLSLATDSERARTNVASMRYVFSGLAALTVAACLTPLLQAGGLADQAVREDRCDLCTPQPFGGWHVFCAGSRFHATVAGPLQKRAKVFKPAPRTARRR